MCVCVCLYIDMYMYRLGWRQWTTGVGWLVAITRLKQANVVYVYLYVYIYR